MDSQYGEIEECDKRGNHRGSFDPNTGEPIKDKDGKVKGPVSERTCARWAGPCWASAATAQPASRCRCRPPSPMRRRSPGSGRIGRFTSACGP
ncbi:hypothetical protein KDL01_39530 [Actinospica durhamensis]|uniref:Colicin E3-like ribonuclease domain-containing protein n=1 Tax=Actinospica durhamensis TaxID=1508375 RepID=A0A941EZE5_9ACTN|nr:hypothetical protein [Actinospica durhamensis]